ncbi:MAG: flagellar motor switch protein FliG [Bacteriovoracaceae bacterium]|nr:flagellar motor switch protein FliG [Bacteriovoracaceae bacterium]
MAEENFDPDQDYSLLTGQDKAAILLSTVGTNATKMIFKYLKDNDIKRIIAAMTNINKIPIWQVKRVLEDFYQQINEENEILFSDNKGRDFIFSALGEDRAKLLLGQVAEFGSSNSLESLELVDTKTLSDFLIHEHPQTISLIVAHLESDKKVDVVRRLPETMQAEIVMRIANLDKVSPDLISQLDEILKVELSARGSLDAKQLGGVQPVAEMLNLMDKSTEKNVISKVEEKDPELAEEIRKRMFVFDDLVHVDDVGIQELLRAVDNSKMVLALKTSTEEVKNKLFKNMSGRAANILKDDLQNLGLTKISEIEKAQQEIIQIIKDLEQKGKATVNRGGEGEQYI